MTKLPRKAAVGYIILLIGVGFGSSEISSRLSRTDNTASHAAGTARSACLIQDRGLRAQGALRGSLYDIKRLLSPLPGEPPQKVPPSVKKVVGDLNKHLDEYQAIEKNQPTSRKC